VCQWEEIDLWFQHDNKFLKPKGIVGLKVYTQDLNFGNCPVARVFAELWTKCFNEYIREFCYLADCADLSFTWNLCIDNLEFEWSGYSDSLPLYIEATL
jgi:secreted Zn-dependent insulinase-like peptidase